MAKRKQISRSVTGSPSSEMLSREMITKQIQQALDHMLEGCMIINRNWVYLYVNEEAAKHGQQKPENLIGKTMLEIYPGVEKTEIFAAYRRCMEEQKAQRFCSSFTFADGKTNWYSFSVEPVPEGIFVLSLDITDSVQAENELRRHRDHLNELVKERTLELQKKTEEIEQFFTVALDLLCIADTDGNFIKLNKAWENVLGYSIEYLEKKKFLDFIHPDDMQATLKAISELSAQNPILNFTNRYRCKDGTYRYMEWRSYPQGKLIYAAARDISEHIKAEKELARLASFPEKNPNPIVEIDFSGKIQYLNSKAHELLRDIDKEEFNHPFLKGIKDLVPDFQKKGNKPLIREVKINDLCYLQTIHYLPKDQRIRIYSIDITERKKAEETLQESEEKYRRIVENTTNVIMVTKPNGIISYLSPSSNEIIGYAPEELVGTNPMIFHPEDVKKVQQALSKALQGEKGFNFEYRILTKTGDVKWISHSWSPIFIDNKIQSIISVIADITERKTTENKIKKLNENLMRRSIELAVANKELETFSYSVSHDLRAPLRSIDGFSQALLEDYGKTLDQNGKEYLQRVRKATQRMEQLIDDMLRLSRLTRVEMAMQKVDLSPIASTIIDDLKKTDPGRKVTCIIDEKLIAEGDANLLYILLENLLGNAWKFTKKCKQAEIEFGKTKHNQETVFFIRDNGAGFDMKYANKLFIPFQRLHDDTDYPGTGIGLGIVSRIIHRHNGRIWAEAEENKGATFYFTIGGKTNG
jgi:PAS domain S-box-containing protein